MSTVRAESGKRKSTHWLRLASWLFGLLAMLAVVALGAHLGDLEKFMALLRAIAPGWLLIALLLQAGTYASVALAWHLGLAKAGSDVSLRKLLPLTLGKQFVDQTLPSGGMSGTAFLVAAMTRRGVPAPTCLASLLVNLVGHYGAYLLAAFAGIALLSTEHVVRPWMIGVTILFALVSLAIPTGALALRRFGGRVPPWLLRIPGVANLLDSFSDAPVVLLRRPGLMAALTAFNLVVVVLDAATLWVMLHALGLATSYQVAFPSFLLAMMVAMLGPIPLGLGTFEATCVTALVMLAVPIEAALAATLLLRGYTTWLPMIPGMVMVRRELRRNATSVGGRVALFLCSAVLLASCATGPARQSPPPVEGNIPEAADLQSPMRDMSLFSGQIPLVLIRATEAPYARPEPLNCTTLSSQIKELDSALGVDIDSEVGKDTANDTTVRLLVTGIRSTIPYFGWIRRLTGADRRERRLLVAVTAGSVRRGYLKGLGDAEGCSPPASPVRVELKGAATKSGAPLP